MGSTNWLYGTPGTGWAAPIVIPGMVVEVDILSSKRSVLDYLLRPLFKTRLN